MTKKLTGEIHHIPELQTDEAKRGGQEEQEQQSPFTEYNNRTFQSFVKNGFADKIPHHVEAPDTRIKKFISKADLNNFQRKIMTIIKLKTRDYVGDSRKKIEKEFLVYEQEWVSKDWLGRTLRCHDNFEGVYSEVVDSAGCLRSSS